MARYLDEGELGNTFPRFNSRQGAFVYSRYPFICGGGGYGGGKTVALVCRALLLSCDSEAFGNLTGNEGLLGRYRYKDLLDTTLVEFLKWCPKSWVKKVWTGNEGKIELVNESLIHLSHLAGTDHLQSLNLGWAGIDQMEQVPEDAFNALSLERIRRKELVRYREVDGDRILIKPRFDREGNCVSHNEEERAAVLDYHTVFGVCNPKPCWIEDKFVLNEEKQLSNDPMVRSTYNPEFKYIHVATRENKGNLANGYIERQMREKTEREFLRDVEGSWEVWDGKVLIGCTRSSLRKERYIPSPSDDIYIGIDHGGTGEDKTKNTGIKAVTFIAYQAIYGKLPQIVTFDELYMPATTIEHAIDLLDYKLKAIYAKMMEAHPDTKFSPDDRPLIKAVRCGHDMNKTSEDGSLTILDKYVYYAKLLGMRLRMSIGDANVAKGIEYIDWALRKGIWTISPNCINTFREFSSLQYGENEKIANKQRDHLFDASKNIASAFPNAFNTKLIIKREKSLVEREIERAARGNQHRDNIYGRLTRSRTL